LTFINSYDKYKQNNNAAYYPQKNESYRRGIPPTGERLMKKIVTTISIILISCPLGVGIFAQGKSWKDLIVEYKAIHERSRKQYNFNATRKAIDVAKEALDVAERQFGPNDPRVAQSLYYLAEEYNIGIDYVQAESLYKRALAIYTKAHKKQTLAYARVLIGLGTLYSLQMKYDQGLVQYQQALETIEKLPKPNTIELAQVLEYMAITIEADKGFAAAEPYYQRSVAVKEKVFGKVSPEVAEAITSLASQYRASNRFAESDRLYNQALDINKKIYGKKDPHVAKYLEQVASYHVNQKEYARAEPYYKEALKLWAKIYSKDHSKLVPHLVIQGQFYKAWGKYEQAESFFQQELAIREKTFGPDDPRLIASLERLYNLYDAQKKSPQAELYYDRLFVLKEKQIKSGTIEWYDLLTNYAEFFVKRGRWAKAEKIYRRILPSYEKFADKNWAFESWIAERLGDLCNVQNKKIDAEGFYNHAVAAWEKIPPPEQETAASVEFLESLAIFYKANSKTSEAERLEKRAQDIRSKLKDKISAPKKDAGALTAGFPPKPQFR
jgi:tetratricopeptide (TPR) repeat protein